MNRPETPNRITHALKKLGVDVPQEGYVINIHALDQALNDSGASPQQKLRLKSDLREARLINP